MNRRRFVGSMAVGIGGVLAGCGGQGASQKAEPPDPKGQAEWVASHDYSTLRGRDIPGIDTDRRGIDWTFRRLGRSAVPADRSTAYLGGEPADTDNAVTAVDLSEGSQRWRATFGDQFESGMSDVVRAGEGAITGFDRGRSESGGGFDTEVSGTVPELGWFDDGGEMSDPMTADVLPPEPEAQFGATATMGFVSNGKSGYTEPDVVGYDLTSGERRVFQRQARLAATTETTAFVVQRAQADRLVAYDTSTASTRWEREIGEIHTITVGPDRVYVVESGEMDRLHALDRTTGERHWVVRPESAVRLGPVILDDAVLVAGHTLSIYDRGGTRRGPALEETRSLVPYDRVRASGDALVLTTRSDRSPTKTVVIDRSTPEVARTVDRWLPILGAADSEWYLSTDSRQRGDDTAGEYVDTRIERRSGSDGQPLGGIWVHGQPVAIDGSRLYTLLLSTESRLGGLYAYDLAGG